MAVRKKSKKSKRKIPFKYRMKMRKWPFGSKKRTIGIIILCFFIAVATFGYLFFFSSESAVESNLLVIFVPQLLTKGYTLVDIDVLSDGGNGIVTLTAGCKRITAYVEAKQAESIYRGMNDIFIDRPNAHDIATDAFDNFEIEVVMVKINEVKEHAFHGDLILKKGNKIVSLDARPSDATAIAVRSNAPTYVKNELFETHGEEIC